MYQELLSQNHFWHVLQTCLDQGEMIFCPAQFFRVNFLLVTCAYKRGSSAQKALAVFCSSPVA